MSKNHAMQSTSVLIKTAKGLEEIDKRTYKLAGRLRALLFMIDGQRTLGHLLDQAGSMADTLERQLGELAVQGFIGALVAEPAAGAGPRLPSIESGGPVSVGPGSLPLSTAAEAAPPPAPRLVPIEELKARLTKMLSESLGMRAMFMTAQIESVKLHQELALVIDEIARSIALSNGVKVAEQWRQRARTLVGIAA